MTTNRFRNIISGLIVLILLIILPFILSEVQLNMAIEIAFFGLFAVSYNLLLSYGGLLSLGMLPTSAQAHISRSLPVNTLPGCPSCSPS